MLFVALWSTDLITENQSAKDCAIIWHNLISGSTLKEALLSCSLPIAFLFSLQVSYNLISGQFMAKSTGITFEELLSRLCIKQNSQYFHHSSALFVNYLKSVPSGYCFSYPWKLVIYHLFIQNLIISKTTIRSPFMILCSEEKNKIQLLFSLFIIQVSFCEIVSAISLGALFKYGALLRKCARLHFMQLTHHSGPFLS